MHPVKSVRKRQVQEMISKINKEIKTLEKRIDELTQLKKGLKQSNLESSTKIKTDKKSLLNASKQAALEAYKKYGKLTALQLKQKVKDDTDLDLKDGDTRKIINTLNVEGKIVKTKSGTWTVV